MGGTINIAGFSLPNGDKEDHFSEGFLFETRLQKGKDLKTLT